MRVLQVTSAYYPQLQFGGPPQQIHALSRGLSDRGHQVEVVTLDSEHRRKNQRALVEGIPVQYLSWVGTENRQVPLDMDPLIAAIHKADIVHCYGLYNLLSPAAAFFSQRNNKPFIVEPMGMAVVRTGHRALKQLYHRIFTAHLLRNAAYVVAGSPVESKELALLVEGDRLVLRRLGVDLSSFESLSSDGSFRQRLGINSDERIVLFIGRISPIKNLDMLVRAFSQADLPHTRLVLVGPILEPKYAAHLRSLIVESQLANRVLLAGPLYDRNKLAALAEADLFVLPSLAESYGIVAAEAVASGVPVLLTETCGVAPQIHERAGLAVPVDQQALTIGLQTLLTDSVRRAKLTERRQEVLKELSWSEPLDQTETMYETILHTWQPASTAAPVRTNPSP